jgi:hypothetical protein
MAYRVVTGLFLFVAMLLAPARAEADQILDLKATDYNPDTGIWVDSSPASNNATQAVLANRPTLVAGQTPNGSAVVRFDGNNFLRLTSGISSDAFTVLAYLRPSGPADAPRTVFGGSATSGSFQYRIGGDGFGATQEALRQEQVNLGHSLTMLSSVAFNNVNVAIDGTGGTFRFDGAADGTSSGSGFTSPSDLIGTRGLGGGIVESFAGDIAEIRVYNTVLTPAERAAIEQQFVDTYAAPAPEPSSLVLVGIGTVSLLAFARRKRNPRKERVS